MADRECVLRAQVEAWLGEISPGTLISLSPSQNTDTISLQFSFGTSNKYRATNVGFGITYVLPILIAILSSNAGSLLLIENPEAHLHPKGQAEMGGLLARAASCGIQVIIETHSDHVLNGIRVAAHDGKIESQDIQLHFFQRKVHDGTTQNEVSSLLIDRDGRIDHWPDGFFDEWDKSLEALLEPRNG
jgi:predicted ATPase